MAPVLPTVLSLLALSAAVVDASPASLPPGRHAPPYIASSLGNSVKRALNFLGKRYYGDSRGLTPPPSLGFKKRAASIPQSWSYEGCAEESWNERLLQGFAYSSPSLTPLQCLTLCASGGYTFAGMEYGQECYCGNEFIGTGGTISSSNKCGVACAGDSSAMCGGEWELSLYRYNATSGGSCEPSTPLPSTGTNDTETPSPTSTTTTDGVNATATASVTDSTTTTSAATPTSTYPVHDTDTSEWYNLGCAVDSWNRVLSNGGVNDYSLTIDKCLISCEEGGYAYAGLEYGLECWCGNTIASTVEFSADSECDVPCSGNSSEMCGGGFRLDVYQLVSSANGDCETTTSPTSTLDPANNIVLPTGTTSTGTAATTTPTGAVETASPNVPSSSDDHAVYAHHMVGNTYPYTKADWVADIRAAKENAIDGFALNMGSDWWQAARIADAYQAAKEAGSFKMFLSLDMTVMSCSNALDAATLVALTATYAKHPAQAMHKGKVLVSTFSGSECTFGTGSTQTGWGTLYKGALKLLGVDIFFVPSIFSDISTFGSTGWMDGELNWNSAWPSGANSLDTSSDVAYMKALGSKEYMPAISPAFFTHFPPWGWNKNWIYRGDDWLYATRWEQVIAMRDKVVMTEILTWNDYGESSYIGPIAGALPAGSEVWTNGFDHTAWLPLTKYYATAFKTGSYPAITKDSIIMWARPHPKAATATSDSVGRPDNWQYADDNLYAIVMATGPATVTLTSGATSQQFSVSAGLNKLKMPSAVGSMSGKVVRSGSTVASYNAGSAYTYTETPKTYNFNYFVGASS